MLLVVDDDVAVGSKDAWLDRIEHGLATARERVSERRYVSACLGAWQCACDCVQGLHQALGSEPGDGTIEQMLRALPVAVDETVLTRATSLDDLAALDRMHSMYYGPLESVVAIASAEEILGFVEGCAADWSRESQTG